MRELMPNRTGWTLGQKWRFYEQRYGWLHTTVAFVGRYSPRLWHFLGPMVPRSYLSRWLINDGRKIVNLGGGGNLREEWLTADIDPRADIYVDLTKPFPFPPHSLDAIVCEEVIEHLTFRESDRMLRECYRTLKPSGLLRISTPNLS